MIELLSVCVFVAIFLFAHYNMDIRNSDKKLKKVKNSKTDIELNNTNMKTILDRKKINANWETFLQNQDKSEKHVKPYRRNNNSFTKTRQLENYCGNVNSVDSNQTPPNKSNSSDKSKVGTLTKCVGIDCEMVGVGAYGRDSILARVSLVNKFGDCIYDKFVKPREKVTDYRTPVSGVRKEDLMKGEEFSVVQKEVADIIKGRVLVAHAIKKDLEVLFLSHPKKLIRDTSKYKPFKKIAGGHTPSLKNLSRELLGVKIQGGEHSSVEDARATMQLYALHQRQWESAIRRKMGGGAAF